MPPENFEISNRALLMYPIELQEIINKRPPYWRMNKQLIETEKFKQTENYLSIHLPNTNSFTHWLDFKEKLTKYLKTLQIQNHKLTEQN